MRTTTRRSRTTLAQRGPLYGGTKTRRGSAGVTKARYRSRELGCTQPRGSTVAVRWQYSGGTGSLLRKVLGII
jgi:hypothetical protein